MAISAQMSLWGLYQIDQTIFDNFSLPSALDRENVIDNLLLDTESLEILYPDPVFLKAAIGAWSLSKLDVWEKLYNTTVLQYNPIENYDRQEDSTSGSSGSATVTNSNTAYNSDTFKDTSKAASSGSNTGTFTSRIHGNIGVTTSQQMIESERKVSEYCIVDKIVNDFIERFCVMVY